MIWALGRPPGNSPAPVDKEDRDKSPPWLGADLPVYNWEDEVKKFAPNLKPWPFRNHEERMEKLKDIEGADLVITSYPLIRRMGMSLENTLQVLYTDEAQHIKNPTPKRQMVNPSRPRPVCLNRDPYGEQPDRTLVHLRLYHARYLYSQTKFRRQFESPIIRTGTKGRPSALLPYQALILRRLKGDVLKELPEKIEHR